MDLGDNWDGVADIGGASVVILIGVALGVRSIGGGDGGFGGDKVSAALIVDVFSVDSSTGRGIDASSRYTWTNWTFAIAMLRLSSAFLPTSSSSLLCC